MSRTIAVVTCSTRRPRLNPFVSAYVHQILAAAAASTSPSVSVELLDLADQALPLYDEPAVPAKLPPADPTPHYAHQHTRAWSATARRYDAFVFVTPQYNWSIPASLKNALDYLFHEWTGKPAAIVTYGTRGGVKAADHLRTVLLGLRMSPVPTSVALLAHEIDIAACEQRGSLPSDLVDAWRLAGQEDNINALFSQLLKALHPDDSEP
ncbi:flavo protein [Trametes coccinea BRFM310]|uniref:Flavo protein n=1 Tax=Trametes coccinea (strain BRFM310) TaxID=1353009 RepID=A0A1Y2I6C6_TRAC3|nr:flavo protein [Trametes coccinea BRFM310]